MQTSSCVPTRIDTLSSMLAGWTNATHIRAREVLTDALHGEVAQAIADSHDLYRRLTTQDRWLSANPTHELAAEREDAYLVNLTAYEHLEAIIGEVQTALGMDTERVRAWQCQGEAFHEWATHWSATHA